MYNHILNHIDAKSHIKLLDELAVIRHKHRVYNVVDNEGLPFFLEVLDFAEEFMEESLGSIEWTSWDVLRRLLYYSPAEGIVFIPILGGYGWTFTQQKVPGWKPYREWRVVLQDTISLSDAHKVIEASENGWWTVNADQTKSDIILTLNKELVVKTAEITKYIQALNYLDIDYRVVDYYPAKW